MYKLVIQNSEKKLNSVKFENYNELIKYAKNFVDEGCIINISTFQRKEN